MKQITWKQFGIRIAKFSLLCLAFSTALVVGFFIGWCFSGGVL